MVLEDFCFIRKQEDIIPTPLLSHQYPRPKIKFIGGTLYRFLSLDVNPVDQGP